MRRWRDRLFVVLIFLIAAGAIYAVWPDQPDRYLPSAIPWPSGRGVPASLGPLKLPCRSTDKSATSATGVSSTNTAASAAATSSENPSANCRGMTLGLDLQGGSRIVLQADLSSVAGGVSDQELDDGMNAAKSIIDSRINPFGVSESVVQRSGKDRLIVELPGVSAQTARDITRPAVLMFCEGLQNGGQATQGSGTTPVAVVPTGTVVYYKPGSCEPDVDANGDIAVATKAADGTLTIAKNADGTIQRVTPQYVAAQSAPRDNIVWTPAKGELNGALTTMTGKFLKSNSQVGFSSIGAPLLDFSMTSDGAKIMGSLTQRLVGMPLATFLDGQPVLGANGSVIAPTIQSQITDSGQTTGLTLNDAQRLRTFLNNGAFPIPLKVIQQEDVDATLGDQAVRDSVQAGLVAMLLVMAFMILYYRLPGVLAAMALVVYTAVVLAIFKIGIPGSGPITLTLAGIAAFVLSVGMAVDANILIFERTKEELRNGRSLIPAVEAGFSRAWPSIRDSNISTLITCAILYWAGNQFSSNPIKGFAITLAIGVFVSLFSAITVTRTFLRLAIATPLARPLWLWTDDAPDIETPMDARAMPGPEAVENA